MFIATPPELVFFFIGNHDEIQKLIRFQPMKTKASQNAHRGSYFRDFLAGEGALPEVEVLVLKRVVFLQLQQILEQEHVTKTELASGRGQGGAISESPMPMGGLRQKRIRSHYRPTIGPGGSESAAPW